MAGLLVLLLDELQGRVDIMCVCVYVCICMCMCVCVCVCMCVFRAYVVRKLNLLVLLIVNRFRRARALGPELKDMLKRRNSVLTLDMFQVIWASR